MIAEWKVNQLIAPSNLFKNKKEVETFLSIPSSIDDLKWFLSVCEQEELYEYCELIKQKLDEEYRKKYDI